ncbi:hypothetical protein FSARC_10332 [Fusarium sarcochroum]|uniref:Zn(2)-C6 fungal-type domain-containing protein n=1 Tax=Fusarium sarcochroum TaxID=1208366 RepID=A0A8H4X4P6_9HYPO|nr:hypothetical protein FSARC_10332 [Fusarium sarcochroum]
MRSASRLKKHRERLACAACRQRKLRCDRESPCGSCVRRRDAASCSYESSTDSSSQNHERQAQAQGRLENLERLVELLAGQRASTTSGIQDVTPAATLPQGPSITEHTNTSSPSPSDLCYQNSSGTTHWSAMLDDIQVLRSTLSSFADQDADAEAYIAPHEQAGAEIGVLFGASISHGLTIEEVLNTHLPSQRATDRMVSTYFRVRLYVTPYIHSSQFRRQYDAFWRDPSAASPLWISMLFSMLYMAANASRTGRGTDTPGNGFTVAAAQCLALGEYFRPKSYSVEALLLYVQSRFITCLEISQDMGSILSILGHVATVSGYHRESGGQGLSPFAREMRRRTWTALVQLDLLISFHLGLPCTIRVSVSDTQTPRNLLDSDFDEDSVRLPPSRPDAELTGVTFSVLKHKFMTIFDKILEHVLMPRIHEATDAVIDSLDAELKSLYNSLPEVYRPRSIADSVIDPPQLIVARLCISFVYYKCLCVLHRPHVTKLRAKSTQEGYTASIALVTDLLHVYEECKPGGQLDTEEWFLKSITWHDFLLGTTTLCLVVYATSQDTQELYIDRSGTLVILERARTVIQAEQADDGAKSRSRVLSIVDATVCQLRGQQNNTGITSMDGVCAMPLLNTERIAQPVADGWFWNLGEVDGSNDTNWDYLDDYLNGSNGL